MVCHGNPRKCTIGLLRLAGWDAGPAGKFQKRISKNISRANEADLYNPARENIGRGRSLRWESTTSMENGNPELEGKRLIQSAHTEKHERKPYLKPTFRFERVFETSALTCGKVDTTEGNCHGVNRRVS
jgi:hypothetical protein